MIKYGYLIIGICYLALSLFYIKETTAVFKHYLYDDKNKETTEEEKSLMYNATRYTAYFILYVLIGSIYVASNWYE